MWKRRRIDKEEEGEGGGIRGRGEDMEEER